MITNGTSYTDILSNVTCRCVEAVWHLGDGALKGVRGYSSHSLLRLPAAASSSWKQRNMLLNVGHPEYMDSLPDTVQLVTPITLRHRRPRVLALRDVYRLQLQMRKFGRTN